MLKIKDEVNLKELEKFGFDKESTETGYRPRYANIEKGIFVDIEDRHIYCVDLFLYVIVDEGLDVIFDLIQAGLVEKAEE